MDFWYSILVKISLFFRKDFDKKKKVIRGHVEKKGGIIQEEKTAAKELVHTATQEARTNDLRKNYERIRRVSAYLHLIFSKN